MPRNNKLFHTFLEIIIASIAIMAIRELLRDDSSRVVSNQGESVLEDAEKMEKIEKILHSSRTDGDSVKHDVLVNLD
jgi:hypothetical protein